MRSLFGRVPMDLERDTTSSEGSMRVWRKRSADGAREAKVHIRYEEDGATLMVDGSVIVHANPTAALLLKCRFSGRDTAGSVRSMRKVYKVPKDIATDQTERLFEEMDLLATGRFLGPSAGGEGGGKGSVAQARPTARPTSVPRDDPLKHTYSAPFRVDAALSLPSEPRPIDLSTWRRVVDRLWTIGVPHVLITGTEPTLVPDITAIVEAASTRGMFVGMLTDGSCLDARYVRRLMNSGLDYLQLGIASMDPAVHARVTGAGPDTLETALAGLEHMVEREMRFIVHIPVVSENTNEPARVVTQLMAKGATRFSLGHMPEGCGGGVRQATDMQLEDALLAAMDAAMAGTDASARVSYFSPPPLMHIKPRKGGKGGAMGADGSAVVSDLALGVYEWGAGRASLFLDPKGRVAVDHRHRATLGKITEASWSSIWYNPMMAEARNRSVSDRRWRVYEKMGLYGYPLYPDL